MENKKKKMGVLGKLFGSLSTNLVETPASPDQSSQDNSPVHTPVRSLSPNLESEHLRITSPKLPLPSSISLVISETQNDSHTSPRQSVQAPAPTNQSRENHSQHENLQMPTPHYTTQNKSPAVSRASSVVGKRSNPSSSAVSRASSVAGKKTKPLSPVDGKLDKEKDKDKDSQKPNVSTNVSATKPRFRMLENGNHEHNLRSAKRQEKLTNMLKDLLGAKKLRDEAKSAVPDILNLDLSSQANSQDGRQKPPTLFAGLVSQVRNNSLPYHGPAIAPSEDCRSFVEKYGRCQEVIGRGSFGVVRVSHKRTDTTEEVLYAVKEFKRRPNELEKKYNRRLTLEFCISLSLKHLNIIDTLDLLKDAKGEYCEVMEFCLGGDLFTLIIALGKLEYAEADCFFKQLIRGVNYMHEMGVSHRDLKPENVLLTQNGVIKITDFGNGECFKMAWEQEIQLSEGICGLSPYIAPEEFTQQSFDPRCVDIWACGVIYMAMRTGRQLWQLADPKKDSFFEEYLLKRKDATGYEPIESLKRARCRNVIYLILDPKPERRITGKQILNSEWGREIKLCQAAEIG